MLSSPPWSPAELTGALNAQMARSPKGPGHRKGECQDAVAGTQLVETEVVRLRIAAKLWRAGLTSEVNQLRRCSASASATAGIRMQCTPLIMPSRCRPSWY